MPTFEVFVNDAQVCLATIDPDGGLHAILSWRGAKRQGCDVALMLSVSGVDGRTEESVRWPVPELHFGDTVSVRVTDTGGTATPNERTAFDPAQLLRQQQEYVRQRAAEWGWEICPEPGAKPAGGHPAEGSNQ